MAGGIRDVGTAEMGEAREQGPRRLVHEPLRQLIVADRARALRIEHAHAAAVIGRLRDRIHGYHSSGWLCQNRASGTAEKNNMNEASAATDALPRRLGVVTATATIVGLSIGSGIFFPTRALLAVNSVNTVMAL